MELVHILHKFNLQKVLVYNALTKDLVLFSSWEETSSTTTKKSTKSKKFHLYKMENVQCMNLFLSIEPPTPQQQTYTMGYKALLK